VRGTQVGCGCIFLVVAFLANGCATREPAISLREHRFSESSVEHFWAYQNSRGAWVRHGWTTLECRWPGNFYRAETWYRHGKRDGPYYSFDFLGFLLIEEHYRDGERHGPRRAWWPENRALKETSYWQHGRLEGEATSFHEDGQVASREHFHNGRLDGLSWYRSKSGVYYCETFYRSGMAWGKTLTSLPRVRFLAQGVFVRGVPWAGDFVSVTGVGPMATTVYRITAYRRGERHGRCAMVAKDTGACLTEAIYERDRPVEGCLLVRQGAVDYMKVYRGGIRRETWEVGISSDYRVVKKRRVDADPDVPKDWLNWEF
jgi:hypothetical protein